MGLLDDAIREHLDLKRRRGADPAEIERAERDALGPVRRGPMGSDEVDLDHAAVPDDDLAYDEAIYDDEPPDAFEEPAGLEQPHEFDVRPGPEPAAPPPPASEYTLGQETEAWDSLEPDAPHLVDDGYRQEAPPLEDEPIAQAPPEPYAPPPTPPQPPAPPPAPAPAEPELREPELREPEPREPELSEPEPLEQEPREPAPPAVDPHATQAYPAEPTSPDPAPAQPHGDILGSDTAEYDMELEEIEGQEDVLEETPEFLQDTPDHDRLWFEQRPPKDFDFDD